MKIKHMENFACLHCHGYQANTVGSKFDGDWQLYVNPLCAARLGRNHTRWCHGWWRRQITLQWRHNGHDGVSNHQLNDCLLNHLCRHRSKTVSLAFVRKIHWSPVNSLHKGPVTRKIFPFDDVIIISKIMTVQNKNTPDVCQIMM